MRDPVIGRDGFENDVDIGVNTLIDILLFKDHRRPQRVPHDRADGAQFA
jgi:hypothetical protein